MNESNTPNPNRRREFWINVAASVVASVVVIALVQPLLTILWDILNSSSSSGFRWLVDRFYKNAALGDRNWVVAAFATCAFVFPAMHICSETIRSFRGSKQDSRKESSAIQHKTPFTKLKLAFLAFIFLTTSLYMATLVFTDLQLNTSFNQRLTVLAPSLEDRQVKILRAQWALMSTRSDHMAIQKQLEDLATKANIKLPENLLND